MDDKNEQIYSRYQLDIKSVYKKRGFIYLDTKEGLYVVKPYNYTEKKAEFENMVKSVLIERGYSNIDLLQKNNSDTYITQNKYGNKFIVKKWFSGEECDINNLEHIKKTSQNLARLHKVMVNVEVGKDDIDYVSKKNILEEYIVYNSELKRVKKYIHNKKKKNRLELEILKYIDKYQKEAEYYYNELKESGYKKLYIDAINNYTLCHGSYTHHSVIVKEDDIATVNFDKLSYGVHVYDLYCLLRKTMEKNDWDIEKGIELVEQYDKEKKLSNDEKEILYILLAYPDKFRKLVNSYYNGKKSLVSIRISEKLDELVNCEIRKKEFLIVLKKYINI